MEPLLLRVDIREGDVSRHRREGRRRFSFSDDGGRDKPRSGTLVALRHASPDHRKTLVDERKDRRRASRRRRGIRSVTRYTAVCLVQIDIRCLSRRY
jgi:hypothetical protein